MLSGGRGVKRDRGVNDIGLMGDKGMKEDRGLKWVDV